jgi:hypothetical protein
MAPISSIPNAQGFTSSGTSNKEIQALTPMAHKNAFQSSVFRRKFRKDAKLTILLYLHFLSWLDDPVNSYIHTLWNAKLAINKAKFINSKYYITVQKALILHRI